MLNCVMSVVSFSNGFFAVKFICNFPDFAFIRMILFFDTSLPPGGADRPVFAGGRNPILLLHRRDRCEN